jgi:hypothetical protein
MSLIFPFKIKTTPSFFSSARLITEEGRMLASIQTLPV